MKILAIHGKADYPFFSPNFERHGVNPFYFQIVKGLEKTSKRTQYQYSDAAEQLLASEKSESIKVDHLAFTFRLSELRHCRKAGQVSFPTTKIIGTKKRFLDDKEVPVKQIIKRQNKYPLPPQIKSFENCEFADFEEYKTTVEKQLIDFFVRTLHLWVHDVLKMELGSLRGKGFNGYLDSMELKANGIPVGYVGIGGQQNTVYFQISGTGCKHLFANVKLLVLHHWLAKVFNISNLSRVDLCYDDYDGNFDCNYAERAYADNAFRTGARGMGPEIEPRHKYKFNADKEKEYSQEMIVVGSRSSKIYWRIYNKKLEQGIKDDDVTWYRSEVELKKWSVDVLLNPAAAFAGLCAFAASIDLDKGVRTKAMTKAKDACLDIAARVRHVRRSAGRALGDILELFQGDIEKTFGLILPDDTGGKLGFPNVYQQLIQVTEVNHV